MDSRPIEPGAAPAKVGCSSGSCGASGDSLAHLPEAIRAKVHNHPCFSEEAHRHYARMHVAVAPACNIQCHYCNRKYDCTNESRPGVVSEVLTPEQAVKKTLAVAAEIPQLSVLGIAGPGDPLANPERTLATFRMLSEHAPDIKLCVSTNGLALPELVDDICRHNIDHVTITINCIDPEIGAAIYPWIFWKNRRVKGVAAARILIEQQQKGLEMLVERGVLVKVNSVLIPGVNDHHLAEVSRVVKAKGAFLHNVMPLIAEPEHGTFYGLMGQRGPSKEELSTLQDECAGDMRMMRHCRQCRADAVGMLGEDRSAEFTLDKVETREVDYEAAMRRRAEVHARIEEERRIEAAPVTTRFVSIASLKRPSKPAQPLPPPALIAVATIDGEHVDQRFGKAREFQIYEASTTGSRLIETRTVAMECSGDCAGEAMLAQTVEALSDCTAVLCAKIGYEAWRVLEQAGVTPSGEYEMAPIADALAAVYKELDATGRLGAINPEQACTA